MKKTADILSKFGKWLLVFGFVFSEVSFPLEVLADELLDDEQIYQEVSMVDENADLDDFSDIQTEEPIIKINGVETTEYTIEEDTDVTVVLEYQGETETVLFDFSNKLYGVYQYTFTLVEETVTINYLGNNALLLKEYEIASDLTKKITCDELECVVDGFGSEVVMVADITSGYYKLTEFEENYDATVIVTNEEGILLDSDSVVNGLSLEIIDNQNDEKLVNTTPNTSYIISRVGDVFVPSDGLIDVEDQEAVLDDILQENELTSMNDVNGDGILNILDVIHSTYMDFEVIDGEVTDILTNTLVAEKEELLIDETVEVKLFVSGFDKASLYGIEGMLAYDDSILELVGASLYVPTDEAESEDLGYLNVENGKFAYVLKNGFNNVDEALITLQFKAISSGVSEVIVSDIVETYSEAFELSNDNANISITVIEAGIGGDLEEDTDDSITDDEDKKEDVVVVRPVVLSSDYYVKSLSIDGYELDFDMYTYEYSIKVGHDVTSLDFSVLLNDSRSIYYVDGNENFKEGENLVYLIVKAENGSTKTYTIRVDKEKEKIVQNTETKIDEEDIVDEEKNNSKTVIIILIILVIIGLIYVIFKDDEEDKKSLKKPIESEKVRIEKVNSESVKIEKVKPDKVKDVKSSNSQKKSSKKKK